MKYIIEPFQSLSVQACKPRETCTFKWCTTLLPILPPHGD